MVKYDFGKSDPKAKVTVEDGIGSAYIKVNGILVAWLDADGTIWRSTALGRGDEAELKALGFRMDRNGVSFGNFR